MIGRISNQRLGTTRERIIEAATQCFEKFGVQRTLIEDIASLAKVSKRTIYTYFESKEDIATAIVQITSDYISTKIYKIITRSDNFDETLVDCLYIGASVAQKYPYSGTFLETISFTSISANPNSKIHRDQKRIWKTLIDSGIRGNYMSKDLTIDDIITWIILSHQIILIMINYKKYSKLELKRFIRDFIVSPLIIDIGKGKYLVDNNVQERTIPTLTLINFNENDDPSVKLLRGAAICFAQNGAKAPSMGDIAECAGVSRRTAYRYFADKRTLVEQFALWAAEQVGLAVGQSVDRTGTFEDILTDSLFLSVRIVEREASIRALDELPEVNASLTQEKGHVLIKNQWTSLIEKAKDAQILNPSLSYQDILNWLFLAQNLLLTKVESIDMDDNSLKEFIARFIVLPIIDPAHIVNRVEAPGS